MRKAFTNNGAAHLETVMKKRGPKPKFTPEQLFDVAMDLITQNGFSGLTLTLLARTVGTSPSALYRYFPNKEALLVALQERAVRSLLTRIEARVQGWEAQRVSALARVVGVFRVWREWAIEAPAEHRVLDAFLSAPQPVLSDENARHIDDALRPIFSTIERVLEAAVTAGALWPGNSRQRGYVAWSALHGLDHLAKRDRIQPVDLQTPALEKALYVALLRGWGASQVLVDEVL